MLLSDMSRFSVENLSSHSAEDFRSGESFTVSLISDTEVLDKRGGGKSIKIFRRNFFVSQCRRNP